MKTIEHIMLDIQGAERATISEALSGLCDKLYSGQASEREVELYTCRGSLVLLQKGGSFTLIDIFGDEEVFDNLIKLLEKERVYIRLVERVLSP